jgi:integrase
MGAKREGRVRIAEGVYEDVFGIAVTVKVGKTQREKRFPKGTKLKVMTDWQDEQRPALRKLSPQIEQGTFAADVQRYLKAVASMPTFKEREAHMALWAAQFGTRLRNEIETVDIDGELQTWRKSGLAESTVRNRRTALMHFYTKMNGRSGKNPVRDALMPDVDDDPSSRAMNYADIETVIAAMPERGQGIKDQSRAEGSKSKARIRVMAYTGLPHKIIKELVPKALDLDSEIPSVTILKRRRKGKGAKPRVLPLTPEAVKAFRYFIEVNAWGGFSNSSLGKSFKRACKAVDLPETTRPYDLRHSFATKALEDSGGDEGAVSEMLVHAPGSKLVRRYGKGSIPVRLVRVTKAWTGAAASGKAGSHGWQPNANIEKTA